MISDFIDFSSQIIKTGDIDPDYIFLKNHRERFGEGETRELFKKKLLIYNLESELLYHTGQISKSQIKFGNERKKSKNHFSEWEEILAGVDFGKMIEIFDGRTYSEFRQFFKEIKGMGDWASWKAADIMNKVFGTQFEFTETTFLEAYEYPLRGLLMVNGREEDTKIYRERDLYLEDFEKVKEISKEIEETEMFSASGDLLTLETCLCKYHSYKRGRYHIGEDITRLKKINSDERLKKYWGMI